MDYIRKNLSGILLVAVGLLLVTFIPFGDRLEGKSAPDLSLAAMQSGKNVDLAQHAGKDVVVLDFFATWCPPCREGLPGLHEIAKEFEGQNVVFYAVNQREDTETVTNYWDGQGFTIPVLMDVHGEAGSAFDAGTIPTTVVVAPNGKVVLHQVGSGGGTEDRLREAIRDAQTMMEPVEENDTPMQEAAIRRTPFSSGGRSCNSIRQSV